MIQNSLFDLEVAQLWIDKTTGLFDKTWNEALERAACIAGDACFDQSRDTASREYDILKCQETANRIRALKRKID